MSVTIWKAKYFHCFKISNIDLDHLLYHRILQSIKKLARFPDPPTWLQRNLIIDSDYLLYHPVFINEKNGNLQNKTKPLQSHLQKCRNQTGPKAISRMFRRRSNDQEEATFCIICRQTPCSEVARSQLGGL